MLPRVGSTAKDAYSPEKSRLVGAFLAVLLFVFIYSARPEDWVPGLSNVPLAKAAGVSAFLALLMSLRHIRIRLPREIIYLILLICQLFIASALSPIWRGGSLDRTFDFAKVSVVVIVIWLAVNTPKRLRMVIFMQAASVAAIAGATLWRNHLLLGRLAGMLDGNYSDPNDLALEFVISLPMCLALLFLARSWIWKSIWTGAILLMTISIFLTGSRGGLFALAITAIVSLWLFGIRGRRPYLLVMTAVLGVLMVASSGQVIVERFQHTFDVDGGGGVAYASAQAHEQLFWRSVEVTEQHPFFGVGPGNFQQISGMWHVTHNSYTQMSSEGGIPALLLYVLILLSAFKNLKETARIGGEQYEIVQLTMGLNASMVGYVIGSCFLTVNYEYYPYLLVAYTTALLALAKGLTDSETLPEFSARGNSSANGLGRLDRAIDSPILAP
jgi:O-antigen ligase